ncbi:glycosyltransferase [Candidatus Gracilibacteria bacterium]|nr:glycosyltransferase [Candidatus Gracilibacteria bacterium]
MFFIFEKIKINLKIFIKYGIVGLSGTAIDIGSLYIFVDLLGINLYIGVTLSFILAVINNFLLNKIWTFRDKSIKYKRQFAKFFIVSIIGFSLTMACMYVLVDILQIYYIYSKIITSIIVVLWNFLGNKYWTFKSKMKLDITQKDDFDIFLSVIIPAYNEEKRIIDTLNKVIKYLSNKDYNYEIIIINDGSKDKTNDIINKSFNDDRIKTISYNNNMGKGYAVKQGMLAGTGKYLLFMDADNSTPIEELDKLLYYKDEYDVIIGSRYMKNSNIIIKQSKFRIAISRVGNFIISLFLIDGITDTQCGFKLFQHNVAKNIFKFQKINGFGFDMEILFIAGIQGIKIKEVPVNWLNDFNSKLSPLKHSVKTLLELVYIKLNYFFDGYK